MYLLVFKSMSTPIKEDNLNVDLFQKPRFISILYLYQCWRAGAGIQAFLEGAGNSKKNIGS